MEQLSVREASERIDVLLDELEASAVPAVMRRVQELLQCVMALQAEGLRRVVEAADPVVVRTLADDEVVGSLLVLHGLHPDDVDTRVRRALEQVRPSLGSHADDVSLAGVDDQGVVHLRLASSGCSAAAVQEAVQAALLVTAPDIAGVETETVAPGPPLLQISRFRPHGVTV
jgi:Fe-S cluster biogenesis protein NfuA